MYMYRYVYVNKYVRTMYSNNIWLHIWNQMISSIWHGIPNPNPPSNGDVRSAHCLSITSRFHVVNQNQGLEYVRIVDLHV